VRGPNNLIPLGWGSVFLADLAIAPLDGAGRLILLRGTLSFLPPRSNQANMTTAHVEAILLPTLLQSSPDVPQGGPRRQVYFMFTPITEVADEDYLMGLGNLVD